MSNSCCTSIMVRLERQDAAKAVIAQKLLMWWLCANRVLVMLSSGGAVIVTMWNTYSACWTPVLMGILSSEILYCGAQLHCQIVSSWYTLLWSYLNLSGQIMSETPMSSVCKLQVRTSWWNVHVLLYAHWWWKTGWSTKMTSNFSYIPVLEVFWTKDVFFVDHLCCVQDCTCSAWSYKITATCLCAAPAGAS